MCKFICNFAANFEIFCMNISIVVPLFNEEESLEKLFEWIARVMSANKFSYEVIFVNDGSTDGSWDVIRRLSAEHKEVHGICFRRNYGKSAALHCGFRAVKGDVVIPWMLTCRIRRTRYPNSIA